MDLKSVIRPLVPAAIKDAARAFAMRAKVGSAKASLAARDASQPWGFQVFAQNGEDGIVDYLVSEIGITGSPFVEIGFSPTESNLLFYAAATGAAGLFIDGNAELIARRISPAIGIRAKVACVWIDRDVNDLITANAGPNVEILSIDMDGNDYWNWESITAVSPSLVITEYNASFGAERCVSTPYAVDFDRFLHHPSGICHGMSLKAATFLAVSKGYSLVCTDQAGLNAFFVRDDRLTPRLKSTSPTEAFRPNVHRNATSRQQQEKTAFLGSVVEII
jgi:hypothetical protein